MLRVCVFIFFFCGISGVWRVNMSMCERARANACKLFDELCALVVSCRLLCKPSIDLLVKRQLRDRHLSTLHSIFTMARVVKIKGIGMFLVRLQPSCQPEACVRCDNS